jgi:hypothetical protein
VKSAKLKQLEKFLSSDNSFKSRKLWFGFLCLVLLSGFVVLAAFYAGIAGLFSEYVAGVLGVFSIFAGSNAAIKWSTAKHVGSQLAGTEDERDEGGVTESPTAPAAGLPARPPVQPLPGG